MFELDKNTAKVFFRNVGMSERSKESLVNVIFDNKAHAYVATSGDAPGLAAEASVLEELREKVLYLIPELIELNGSSAFKAQTVPVELLISRTERMAIA